MRFAAGREFSYSCGVQTVMKYVSIALAVVVLGGAGVYWWTFGGRHQEAGASSNGACKHGFLKADCPFCTPSLVEQRGQCKEHGVPEALCWRCNKKLVAAFKAEGDWCEKHNAPESLCPVCNDLGKTPEGKPVEACCPEDKSAPEPVADKNASPRSGRDPSLTCKKSETKVRLASAEIVRQAGLGFVEVERRPVTTAITCNAEVAYDGNRFAQLSARATGMVHEIRVDLGSKVSKGDVLAVIDSLELASAKADYLQAGASVAFQKNNLQRKTGLAETGGVPQREVQEVDNKLVEARIAQARAAQRLHVFGLTDSEIQGLQDSNDTGSLLPLTAPFDGEIVDRAAVVGETVEATKTLFGLADTRHMWAMIDVSDLRAKVRVGQAVTLTVEGLDVDSFPGEVTWISTRVDPKTRTLKLRAEFDNAGGLLKANMFGRASVVVRDHEPLVLVPKSAVQWDGCCNVVFVKTGDTVFESHKVRLGQQHDDLFEVISGVETGQTVVAQGSFLLKTEILKGEIGAGCCPDDIKKK
jgi:membrane fusion protein, heavy metal efflux system